MSDTDTLLLLAKTIAECTEGATDAEQITVQYGALEAIGHLTDPGDSTVDDAMRQGMTMLRIWSTEPFTDRTALLFAVGFIGLVLIGGAVARNAREGL